MSETDTSIYFAITLRGRKPLGEAEARAVLAEDPAAFGHFPELEGQLCFSQGGAELIYYDVLAPSCLALVRTVAPKLSNGEAARIEAHASDLDLDFDVRNDTVVISTEDDDPVEMPSAVFHAAARAAAQRFGALAVEIWPDEPQAASYKDFVDARQD